jgi:hypothetical protein
MATVAAAVKKDETTAKPSGGGVALAAAQPAAPMPAARERKVAPMDNEVRVLGGIFRLLDKHGLSGKAQVRVLEHATERAKEKLAECEPPTI